MSDQIMQSVNGTNLFGEGTSRNLPKWMRTQFIGENSHLQETSSHIVPYRLYLEETKLGKGKGAISPLISRSKQCDDHHQSADLVCVRKSDCCSQSGNSMDEGNEANIMLDRYLSAFGRDCVSENQNCSGIGMFPGHSVTEAEKRKSRNDCDSLLKLQSCVHDVERERICTTMEYDSEELARGCPGFSQATQGLLITEKIDVNLLKEDDVFKSTRVISTIDGDTSSDVHHVSLFLGQGKSKLESEPLSSSIDLDVKEKVRDLKASEVSIKNEFSAETDTVEMESSREKKLHSGSFSNRSTKVLNNKSNPSSWLGLASSVKVESQQSNIELPDMNFPALPENTNTHPISSKKTRSLQKETLLGHDEEYPNADPGMRWVKRLKLNSSNSSAQYTKISENQSHENVSKSFSTIPESSLDHDNISEDPSKKAKGLLLSHAWVQRWLSNRSRIAPTKPETLAVQGSRFALEKLERETCPSIAAMALMGKALSCFQPCDFQKRGSLTVWNTNAI